MSLMQGLSGWLKQIIAVVLLASLVDLLLPNRTMQRYVRLVAGLFVLLTVATPVLKWMQGDFGAQLAAELDAATRPPHASNEDLSHIQNEGRKLRERQNADAANLVAARLAEAMRTDIEQNENRQVRNVEVKLATQPDGSLAVHDVVVTLEAAKPKAGAAEDTSKAMKPIAKLEQVAPVTVDVSPSSRPNQETAETNAQADPATADVIDRPTRLRISAFLAARYGIPADRVVVAETTPNGG
jgi:stage III sporulation protein AF